MTNRFSPKHIGMIAIGAGLAAASVYMVMIKVTLAYLERVSGHIPFDMRPLGYGSADASALLAGLGEDGRQYYLTHQIPLDALYPALLALTLIATIWWLGQRMPNSSLVRLGFALSIGAALFDYGENFGIVAMIWNWPEVSIPLVYATSTASIAKSVVTTLAVLLTVVLAIRVGLNRARRPKAELCD